MKYFTFLAACVILALSWCAWLGGYFYPRVTLNTYHEMELKDNALRRYDWWAISVHFNGNSTCLKTFSEDRGDTFSNAFDFYRSALEAKRKL